LVLVVLQVQKVLLVLLVVQVELAETLHLVLY
jgi:hypothetical protein